MRAAATLAILAWLARGIDMAEAARAIAAVSLPHLAAVLALVALDRAVMILRWVLLLRAAGVAVPVAEAARVFLVSSFVGSFLPAGLGGDAARTLGLAPYTRGSEALASVAVDRLLGVISLVALGAVGLIVWAPGQGADWRVAAAAAALAALSIAVFWADRVARWLVPNHLHDGWLRPLIRTSDAVSRYRTRRATLVHVMAWSIAVQGLRVAQAWGLALGLGLQVPLAYLMLVMPVGLLMMLLPVSVSGFGLPQAVIVWLLRPAGVPDHLSFALSTLIALTGLAGSLPGGVVMVATRASGDPAER